MWGGDIALAIFLDGIFCFFEQKDKNSQISTVGRVSRLRKRMEREEKIMKWEGKKGGNEGQVRRCDGPCSVWV